MPKFLGFKISDVSAGRNSEFLYACVRWNVWEHICLLPRMIYYVKNLGKMCLGESPKDSVWIIFNPKTKTNIWKN